MYILINYIFLGNIKIDDNHLISIMKANKLVLNEDVESKINDYIVNRINNQNVLNFYQLAKLYNLSRLAKEAFTYIERCFTMVVETPDFLELDYTSISTILSSSGLLITSELEVYGANDIWLSYNIVERSKFAKDLLLKVRLPLLSDETLKYLLKESSSFTNNDACMGKLENTLNNKDNLISNNCTHRYCNQSSFNILLCGGDDNNNEKVNTVYQIDGNKLENIKMHSSMIQERFWSEAVCLKGEPYVFGGRNGNFDLLTSVEKYSPSTKTWNIVADMYDNRKRFCACAFTDKIFIIGGFYLDETDVTNTCVAFDKTHNDWKEVAEMNQVRESAACTIFEGRIVVSGGQDDNDIELNTVESYDVIAAKWSSMPNMIDSKIRHSLVVVRKKLFVIGYGTDTCEVYESRSKNFVALKSQPEVYVHLNKTISIGNKILVFQDHTASVHCYDVDENEWSEESCEVTKHIFDYSCVKLPFY